MAADRSALPLPDGAHVGSRPYIRPLARTRDEHDRFILTLLSLDRSQFFVSQIGQVEEVLEVRGERAVPKPEATRNEARVLARVAELVLAQFEGRHLLLSAAPELRAEFINHLGESAQHNLGTEFSVDIHAGPAVVAAAAEPARLPRGRLRNARRSKRTATSRRQTESRRVGLGRYARGAAGAAGDATCR